MFFLLFSFQLTEAGESGVSGAHVQRRANKENNPGLVNATHQLLSMAERNAMDSPVKLKCARKMFHAQVSCMTAITAFL